jgi:polar amino acid transport system substrate-binding protein
MTSSTSFGLKPMVCRTFLTLSLCALSSLVYFSNSNAAEKTTLETIKKEGVLKVCSESGYLPLEMKTASGKWIGFDPKMMEAFAKSLSLEIKKEIKLQMLDTKWDGIIPSLLTGKCDMIASSMARTKEREKAVTFSDPYYDNKFLIALKDTPENRKNYKTLEDFDNSKVKVAVKTGSAPDLYLQDSKILKKAQIMRFDADADTVNAVLGGRSNAFIYDTPYVKLAALNNPGKIYIIPNGFNGDKFAVAMRKKDESLAKSFNSFLDSWKNDGGYDKAMKYYFEGQEWIALLDK